MFKPVTMIKTNLFVLNSDLQKVTGLIYDLKLVEFFQIDNVNFSKHDSADLSEITSELLKYRSIITILKYFYKNEVISDKSYIIDDILKLKQEYDDLNNKRLHLIDENNRKEVLLHLKLTKDDLNNKKSIIGFVNSSDYLFFKHLKELGLKYKTFVKKNRVYFYIKNLNNKKIELPFKEFYVPKNFDRDIFKKLDNVKIKLDLVKNNLILAANSNLKKFQIEELKLTKKISILEVKHKFLKSENISILSGYLEKKYFKKLNFALQRELGDNFVIEKEEVIEDAPVKLNNGGVFRDFEALIKMYSLPKYTEFDPTILLTLIFPLFFGFILGDVVYGLISLLFFTFLKLKYNKIKDFLSILQVSAISSIFFGFIYGEFMGFELKSSFYGFFERSHNPEMLLIVAVLFGLMHINLGLIIGFINEKRKGLKHAITDKASWMVLQIAVGFLALGFYGSDEIAVAVGVVFFILSVVLIYMGHGFIGLIEIPSFFTNIFSYARLMAVGLSSIAIAVLVNEYTQVLFSKGIFGALFAILLFTFGHIFNIVLGNFEGFIHTMRLHYVEFFTKFYTGGGREFIPFGKKIHDVEE